MVRNHRMVRSKAQTSEPGGQRTHYNKCAHPTCSSSLISIQIFDIHTTEPEQLAQQVLHWVVNYTTTNFYSPQTLSLLGCPALRADDPAPRYCKARAEGERNRWKKKKRGKQWRRCLGRESASSTKVVRRRLEKEKKTSVNGRLEEEEEDGVMKVRRPVGDWLSGVAARTDGHCKPVPLPFRATFPTDRAGLPLLFERKTTHPSRYGTTLGVPETNARIRVVLWVLMQM